MKVSQLKELVKQVVKEENDYQQLFKHMLDKSGKSISSMSDDDKKKFFNAVDTAYKAKSEGKLRGYNEAELTAGQKKLDVDKDGDIGSDDLADLRAGKKVSESVNEAPYNHNNINVKDHPTIVPKKYIAKLPKGDLDGYIVKNGNNFMVAIIHRKHKLQISGGTTNSIKNAALFLKKNGFDLQPLKDAGIMKPKTESANEGKYDTDLDKIEGSDLAALRAKNEVGTNDWHFKAIMKMYDLASSFGKKKIGSVVCKNPNASKNDIARELRNFGYRDVTDVSDQLGLAETFKKAQKKKVVNEGVVEGILATITLAILGKIVIYFIYELAKKVGNYINGSNEYKKAVAKILESISNNKQAMNDIAKLLDSNDGINSGVADRIVKMGYVQTQITKMSDSTNGELDETELKNHLKTALVKAWEDKGLTGKAAEKVKKDIK